jgi:hypothetical protein
VDRLFGKLDLLVIRGAAAFDGRRCKIQASATACSAEFIAAAGASIFYVCDNFP